MHQNAELHGVTCVLAATLGLKSVRMAGTMIGHTTCFERAFELVCSGSFVDVAQLKHQLEVEGYDVKHLNDCGLARGLAIRRMYLWRASSEDGQSV